LTARYRVVKLRATSWVAHTKACTGSGLQRVSGDKQDAIVECESWRTGVFGRAV